MQLAMIDLLPEICKGTVRVAFPCIPLRPSHPSVSQLLPRITLARADLLADWDRLEPPASRKRNLSLAWNRHAAAKQVSYTGPRRQSPNYVTVRNVSDNH